MTGSRDRSGQWAVTVIAALLSMASAATDIMAFTRLGEVFASVMTSNIVFLGLAAAQHSGTLAVHAAVSFAGYVLGVAAASRLVRRGARSGAPDSSGAAGGSRAAGGSSAVHGSGATGGSGSPWTPRIAVAVAAEIALLAGFTAGWELTGARPSGGTQLLLIGLATVAMGIQSAVVVILNIAGVATTYLTGTLTALIDSIARPAEGDGPSGRGGRRGRRQVDARRALVLAALAVGALLAGLLLSAAPAAVPVIPLAALTGVLTIGTTCLRPRRRQPPRSEPAEAGPPSGEPRRGEPPPSSPVQAEP